MRFFFSHIFWGALLILIGVSAILKSFNINIPIFRIVFAFLFIYTGVSILVGHNIGINSSDNTVLFSDTSIKVTDIVEREYNIIFGKGIIDLRDVKLNGQEKIEANVIFGSGEILLNPEIPVTIRVSSAFGNAKLPDKSSVTFGELTYRSGNFNENEAYLLIEANTVFGGIKILN
jgi:hypothetical protein